MGKNVIITGATGMIGGMILDKCLASNEVQKVTSVVRKPTGRQHEKLVEVVHTDFLDFSNADFLQQQDVCYFCIGVYTGQVPRDEFRKITVDYTNAFASALRAQNNETAFCFLSGDGADRSEKSRIMFKKDKGVAENILIDLHFHRLHIFRPGYIYPSVPRKEPNRAYVFFRYAYKGLFQYIYPNIGLTSEQLSTAMMHAGLYGDEKETLENRDIRRLAKTILYHS